MKVGAYSMDNYSYDDLFKNYEVKYGKNYTDNDGVKNSHVIVKGIDGILRARSEVLITRKNKVYLYFTKDGSYKIPGGTWDELDGDHAEDAKREAQEEAMITVKSIKYIGTYVNMSDERKKWMIRVIPEDNWWDGYYNQLYIGEYGSEFLGYIEEIDRDDDMTKHGRFYNILDIIDRLKPQHQYALMEYLNLNEDADIKYNNSFELVEESIGNKKAYPVYIVTSFTFTPMGKVIVAYQKSEVSHAAIAFDPSLDAMYTFSVDLINDPTGGLRIESLDQYKAANPNSYIRVVTIFLKKKDYDIMREKVMDMVSNISKYKYHTMGLVDIILNKSSQVDYEMICSEFVARILQVANIDLGINKSANLISPKDFHQLPDINPKSYIVYDGYCRNYDENNVKRIINKLKPSADYIKESALYNRSFQYTVFHDITEPFSIDESSLIVEAKEFPIDFEDDGSIIIRNYKKLDFEAEFAKSHKLLMIYAKTGNLEGIKYELSKLWFINNVLEKRIYSNPNEDELKRYTRARAKILNDFNKYLQFVLEREPDFNFTEYYNNSPYSDVSIRIPGSLLRNLAELLKQILG